WAEPGARVGDVGQAETRVDERQAGLGLGQQDVTDQVTARCTHGPAVEVMNPHLALPVRRCQRTYAAEAPETPFQRTVRPFQRRVVGAVPEGSTWTGDKPAAPRRARRPGRDEGQWWAV